MSKRPRPEQVSKKVQYRLQWRWETSNGWVDDKSLFDRVEDTVAAGERTAKNLENDYTEFEYRVLRVRTVEEVL